MKFSERYAVLALNGLEKDRMTLVKKVALRGIIACQLFENEGKFPDVKSVVNHSGKLSIFEDNLVGNMILENKLQLKNSIFSIDYVNQNIGLEFKEYISDFDLYQEISEQFKIDLLENEIYQVYEVFLTWALREADLLSSLFSTKELETIDHRISEFHSKNRNSFYDKHLLNPMDRLSLYFIGKKYSLYDNSKFRGLNYMIPAVNRRKVIFVESEEYLSDSKGRLDSVINRLFEKNIEFEIISTGKTPLLKIQNKYYHAVPSARKLNKINITGVELRQVYN